MMLKYQMGTVLYLAAHLFSNMTAVYATTASRAAALPTLIRPAEVGGKGAATGNAQPAVVGADDSLRISITAFDGEEPAALSTWSHQPIHWQAYGLPMPATAPDDSPSPALYFDYKDVAELQASARSDRLSSAERVHRGYRFVHDHMASNFPPPTWAEFAQHWNEQYGNLLIPIAFSFALEPTQEKMDLGIAWLDQLASYPNWTSAAAPHDEVTVAHVLHGFVTAVDILYPVLSVAQQARYLATIHRHTGYMYDRSFISFWGTAHIQNHVWTNMGTLYMSALFLSHHAARQPAALLPVTTRAPPGGRNATRALSAFGTTYAKWARRAHDHLERTLLLLDHVPDGSFAEGVFYGDYSARALVQHVFLMQRHGAADHTQGTFVRRLLDFYLYTTLPGARSIIQFADSDSRWAYGPVMQLRFIDTFVLRDGRANELADLIASAAAASGTPFTPSSRLSTLHTEYIFHTPALLARDAATPAAARSAPALHHFADWGVVTYGCGMSLPNTTAFAFRAGMVMGSAVLELYKRRAWPWFSLINAGHENPDQGSFVFYPRGAPLVVTPGYIKPKSSLLANTLVFSSAALSAPVPSCGGSDVVGRCCMRGEQCVE